MASLLNYTAVTPPQGGAASWLLALHGIYGSGRNWGTIARRLVQKRPDWGVLLVDLRLHGESTAGFSPPHTVAAAAADIAELVAVEGLAATAVLGHSFGGKVALEYARGHGEGLRQVWAVDSTLNASEPSGSAWQVLQAVRSLPDRFPSREALIEGLGRHGHPPELASWLGMNLERADGELRWRLDWDGVEEMLRDYFRTDVWEVVEAPPDDVEVHVLRATESSALGPEDVARIRAAEAAHSRTHIHELVGGHWIHVDNPDALVELLTDGLPSATSPG
ncbi:MAG TPA: alpha/beta hydrolase [Longimicrobiaceae bacterium]